MQCGKNQTPPFIAVLQLTLIVGEANPNISHSRNPKVYMLKF
jgi:hypothetical protein